MNNETQGKNHPKSVRFAKDDKEVIEKAARLEGLDASAYIRRSTIQYTREHHPELFLKS